MELKDILGEDLAAKVQTAVDAYNSKADKKAKLVDLSGGDYARLTYADRLKAPFWALPSGRAKTSGRHVRQMTANKGSTTKSKKYCAGKERSHCHWQLSSRK